MLTETQAREGWVDAACSVCTRPMIHKPVPHGGNPCCSIECARWLSPPERPIEMRSSAQTITRDVFARMARGLPFIRPNLAADVVHVEPIDASYFRDDAAEQRCIVRLAGKFYVSTY